MKNFNLRFVVVLLCAVATQFALPIKACDRSDLTLLGVTALPGNQYALNLRYCVGAGITGASMGADNNTSTFAFFLTGNAQFASHPSQIVSPQTGFVYLDTTAGVDTLVYYSQHYFTGPYEPWACIFNCGQIQTVCYDITIVTTGLPTSVRIGGIEGDGNISAGCTGSDMTVYPGGFCPIQLQPTLTQPVCTGNTGSIALSPTGGTAPYNFQWSNGATTSSISGLAPGSYSVTVGDISGACVQLGTYTINTPIAFGIELGANKTVYRGYTPLSCSLLSPVRTGGVSPFTYRWSTGATTTTLNVCPIVTTTFSLTVTDARGCTVTDNVVVNVIDVRCGSSLNKVLVCHNGSTMCVTSSQAATHVGHGDALGTCSNKDAEAQSTIPATYQVTAYPVPASADLHLEVQSIEAGAIDVDVYDLQGKHLAHQSSLAVEGLSHKTFTINVSQWNAGMYFARIQHATLGLQTLKFSVVK